MPAYFSLAIALALIAGRMCLVALGLASLTFVSGSIAFSSPLAIISLVVLLWAAHAALRPLLAAVAPFCSRRVVWAMFVAVEVALFWLVSSAVKGVSFEGCQAVVLGTSAYALAVFLGERLLVSK